MDKVERIIGEVLHSVPDRFKEMLRHLLENRGKMLRPRLLIVSASLASGGKIEEKRPLYRAAAAAEMIHIASLIHDDIIDDARLRRGRECLHLLWGKKPAVLAGDILLARAFALLSGPGGTAELLKLMARSVALLCRGELHQMDRRYRWDLTEHQYYRTIHLKTAQFIASCCEAGGRLAGSSPPQQRALREYGNNLGQAFQLVNDLVDYADHPLRPGKQTGSDLKQGLVTLPLIHLFKTRRQYLQMVRQVPPDLVLPQKLQEMLQEAVRENGSLDYTRAAARYRQKKALRALQLFPAIPERQMLSGMVMAVTDCIPGAPDPR